MDGVGQFEDTLEGSLALSCANNLRSQASAWRMISERSSHWGRQPSRLRIRSVRRHDLRRIARPAGGKFDGKVVSGFVPHGLDHLQDRKKAAAVAAISVSGSPPPRRYEARDNERLRGRSRGYSRECRSRQAWDNRCQKTMHLLSQTHAVSAATLIRCVAPRVACPVRRAGSAPATLKYLKMT